MLHSHHAKPENIQSFSRGVPMNLCKLLCMCSISENCIICVSSINVCSTNRRWISSYNKFITAIGRNVQLRCISVIHHMLYILVGDCNRRCCTVAVDIQCVNVGSMAGKGCHGVTSSIDQVL